MSQDEYMEYAECRQASFVARNARVRPRTLPSLEDRVSLSSDVLTGGPCWWGLRNSASGSGQQHPHSRAHPQRPRTA